MSVIAHRSLLILAGNVRLRAQTRAVWLQLPPKQGRALRRPQRERAQPDRGREDVHGEHPRDVHARRAHLADRADVVPGAVGAAQPEREHSRVCGFGVMEALRSRLGVAQGGR